MKSIGKVKLGLNDSFEVYHLVSFIVEDSRDNVRYNISLSCRVCSNSLHRVSFNEIYLSSSVSSVSISSKTKKCENDRWLKMSLGWDNWHSNAYLTLTVKLKYAEKKIFTENGSMYHVFNEVMHLMKKHENRNSNVSNLLPRN